MLNVTLNGNGSGFKQMLDSAKTQVTAFNNAVTHEVNSSWGGIGKSITGAFAGVLSMETLKEGMDWFVETGKSIKETAEQVDMSSESWQKWSQAVDDAGMSTGGFMKVLEDLRQKRTEALTDPKARGDLTKLGFTDAEITGDMDMDTFLKRALGNAHGGDLQRKYLADIIGQRGLKYASVVDSVDKENPEFNNDALNEATQIGKDEQQVKRGLGGFAALAIDTLFMNRDKQKAFGLTTWRLLQSTWGRGWLWNKNASWKDGIANVAKGLPANYQGIELNNPAAAAAASAAMKPKSATTTEPDPLDAVLSRQREEQALHDEQRQQRLLDSQRGLMTIGDRRASLSGELVDLQKQIGERQAKMQNEGFLTDADKNDLTGVTGKARDIKVNELRQKYQDQTDEFQMRANRLTCDLREKPLSFNADTLSKAGLYSASALSFNPVLGIAQQQLTALKQIVTNTAPKPTVQGPKRDSFGDNKNFITNHG